MPRKAAVDPSAEPVEPRRSSRISSQSKPAPAPVPEKKPRKAGKKRTADESQHDDGETEPANGEKAAASDSTPQDDQSNKKAKNETTEADEEKDELASDISEQPRPLEIGDLLPTITLKNEKDEDVNVQDLANESGVVIFLVPKADTPGCTTQACGFRDIYPDFQAVDYKVYCLSADKTSAQSKWQIKKELPYPLLSDPQRVFIKALGAGTGNKTTRSHFVFEKGGKLVEKRIPVKPADRLVSSSFLPHHTLMIPYIGDTTPSFVLTANKSKTSNGLHKESDSKLVIVPFQGRLSQSSQARVFGLYSRPKRF